MENKFYNIVEPVRAWAQV